jgi:hypothetical protein
MALCGLSSLQPCDCNRGLSAPMFSGSLLDDLARCNLPHLRAGCMLHVGLFLALASSLAGTQDLMVCRAGQELYSAATCTNCTCQLL